jgi:hypothetical protein
MTAAIARTDPTDEAIELALVEGDLSRLTSAQRRQYYLRVCESMGLNPLTKPMEYLKLNGKMLLYATKSCTDQLRATRDISVTIVKREVANGVCEVTARAMTKDGREDTDVGAVFVDGLRGEALANAIMKAHTKAKRRVTLSISGLSVMDETEVETIRGAERVGEDGAPAIPQLAPARPASTPPPASMFGTLADMVSQAPTTDALRAIWADCGKAAKAQHITLSERAELSKLKDQRKAELAKGEPVEQVLAGNEMPAGWGGTEEHCLVCNTAIHGDEPAADTTSPDGVVGRRHRDCLWAGDVE